MQVNSVSSSAVKAQMFGNRKDTDALIGNFEKKFASLDDLSLKKLAYMSASEQVQDKKHKIIDKAIVGSIPLAAGVAAAVAAPLSRAGKLGVLLSQTLSWVGTFAVIDAVFGGKRLLEKASPKANNFNKEHPMLSFVAGIGASLGALALGRRALPKLLAKVDVSKLKLDKFLPKLEIVTSKINNSRLLNKVSSVLHSAPGAIKSVGKALINNGIWVLAGLGLIHSVNHNSVKNKVAVNEYIKLKDAQEMVVNRLAQEEAASETEQA